MILILIFFLSFKKMFVWIRVFTFLVIFKNLVYKGFSTGKVERQGQGRGNFFSRSFDKSLHHFYHFMMGRYTSQ